MPAHRLRPSFKDIEIIIEDDGPPQSHAPIWLYVGEESRALTISEVGQLLAGLNWALIDAHRDRDAELMANTREPDGDDGTCRCYECTHARPEVAR